MEMNTAVQTESNSNIEVSIKITQGGNALYSGEFSSFPVICGRSRDCDIVLADVGFISRNHFAINCVDEQILISDLDSKYGITYKGQRVPNINLKGDGIFNIHNLEISIRSRTVGQVFRERKTAPISIPHKDFLEKNKGSIHKGLEIREELFFEHNPNLYKYPMGALKAMCVISWHGDVYEVFSYSMDEDIIMGPQEEDSLYLPMLNQKIKIGRYDRSGLNIFLNKDSDFKLLRGEKEIGPEVLAAERRISNLGSHLNISLKPGDSFYTDIGNSFSLHMGYIVNPTPFLKKSWIENKEEFKRAIKISAWVHAIVTAFALMVTPKPNVPKIEGVEPRYARLLVEPPKQILAPPPPIRLKPPPPPPPPPPEEKPPEPVKEKPKPVKMVVEKKLIKPRPNPVPKKQVERKLPPAPPVQQQVVVEEPKPTKAEATLQELNDLFSDMPKPGGSSAAGTGGPVKISRDAKPIKGALPKAVDVATGTGLSSGINEGPSLGKKVGRGGYQEPTVKGVAGKRAVKGAVVGTPSFKPVKTNQGLTNDEVMKVINKAIQNIQQCYERELFNDPNLSGRVEYEWEINPQGRVVDISVKSSEMGRADKLNNCVMKVIRGLSFPKSKNGQSTIATIGFPFGKR